MPQSKVIARPEIVQIKSKDAQPSILTVKRYVRDCAPITHITHITHITRAIRLSHNNRAGRTGSYITCIDFPGSFNFLDRSGH